MFYSWLLINFLKIQISGKNLLKMRYKYECINKILTNGIEIRDVADILGHRNVETTKNYYISSTEKSRRLATDVFDKITKSEIIEEIIKYE